MLACHPGAEYERLAERNRMRTFPLPMRGASTILAFIRLTHVLQKEKIDVIDAHGGIDHQISTLAALFASRPIVIRTKHNDTSLRSGFFSRTIYQPPFTQKIVAVSEAVRRQLINDGIVPAHVVVIYTGVDTARFRPGKTDLRLRIRRRYGVGEGQLLIGGASRLHESKGIDYLLHSLAIVYRRVPEIRYVHVGHGPAPRYLELARRLGLPEGTVIFPGRIREVEDFYPALDIFCRPSRHEALGTAVLEAMASGLPVVASRVGGLQEAVFEGVTGLLVEPGDTQGLAQAIMDLAGNSAQRVALGEAARQRVLERFPIQSMFSQTERLYDELLAERRSTL